jgi:hypothetical protein
MCGNSKFNCSETEKKPEKYAGFPAGWKKAGPLPPLRVSFRPLTQWKRRKKRNDWNS